MTELIELTRSNYNEEINESNNNLCVIYFGAPSCGPCKIIKPQYKKYVKESEEPNVKYYMIDTSKNKRITVAHKVMSQPSFVFMKSGNEVSRLTGVQVTIENMVEKIKKYR